MKWRIIKISNLILALLLVAFTIGYTYAWFADYYSVDIKLYVSPDGGYFASGSGTDNDPYIITKPTHLYNLAWLQNSGKFSSTEPTYFQIGNDDNNIDMNGYVIPPIGNDAYPFIGVFDGNGCTISNLIVSTDKTKLTNFPVESATGYEFSSYVGLFGKTGTYTDGTSNETCGADIKNFILDDPILEVATDSNTLYSTATNESYCGLAIGYVAYKASSIGVIGGTLAVKKEGYSTYNSILGYFDEDKFTTSITGDYNETQEVTTVTGGDTGYFIPDVLFGTITGTNNYVSSYTNSTKDEIQFKARTWLTSVKGKSEVKTNDYLGLGNFTVINGTSDGSLRLENIESWNESNIDSNYYNGDDSENPYINAFQVSAGTYTIDGTEYTTSGDTIVYLANGANATAYSTNATKLAVANYFKSLVVDLEGTEYQKLSYLFYYKNSPTNVSKSLATEVQLTVYGEDDKDVTGTSGGSTNNYYVFDNSIQVNISDPSNAKIFVIASSRSSSDERTLGVTQVYNETDSSFTFYNDYTTFNSNQQKGDPKSNPQVTFSLPVSSSGAIIMGYEIDLSSYGAGIYSINMKGSDGINIYYLAITGLDGTSGEPTYAKSDGTYNSDCDISAVDFIYKDVSITQSETTDSSSGETIAAYNFVYNSTTLYTPTGTRIWLNVDNSVSTVTTAVLIIAYTRDDYGTVDYENGSATIDGGSYTISVTYNSDNGSDTDTPGDSQLTGYAYFIKDSSTFITDTYFSTYYSKIVDVYENNSG